jgi:ribosomal protein S3
MLDNGRRMQLMKMVVTNSTAGMIIGKGGATVKSLNETYDVRIQASQKDDVVMGERVLTILGPEEG